MGILGNVIQQEDSITGAQYTSIGSLLSLAINVFLGVGISISVIAIVLSGIKILTSMGNPKVVETGRASLKYSILALILCMGALTVKYIVFGLIGLDESNLMNGAPNF